MLHDSDPSGHRLRVFDAELFSKHLYCDRSAVGSNAVAAANGVPESPPAEFPPQGCKLSEELRQFAAVAPENVGALTACRVAPLAILMQMYENDRYWKNLKQRDRLQLKEAQLALRASPNDDSFSSCAQPIAACRSVIFKL